MKNNSFKVTFNNLEEFADIISEILQCPITVEDVNHRLLAYSTHDERTDSARVATIMGRRVPEKVINNLWKEGIIPALLKSREPIHVKRWIILASVIELRFPFGTRRTYWDLFGLWKSSNL